MYSSHTVLGWVLSTEEIYNYMPTQKRIPKLKDKTKYRPSSLLKYKCSRIHVHAKQHHKDFQQQPQRQPNNTVFYIYDEWACYSGQSLQLLKACNHQQRLLPNHTLPLRPRTLCLLIELSAEGIYLNAPHLQPIGDGQSAWFFLSAAANLPTVQKRRAGGFACAGRAATATAAAASCCLFLFTIADRCSDVSIQGTKAGLDDFHPSGARLLPCCSPFCTANAGWATSAAAAATAPGWRTHFLWRGHVSGGQCGGSWSCRGGDSGWVHSRLAPWPYWRHVPAWKNGKCYVLKSCPVGVQDSWGHTF